jgi:ATP-binding cassette, subfamily B, bacterial PglK
VKDIHVFLQLFTPSLRRNILGLSLVSLAASVLESAGIGVVYFIIKLASDPAEVAQLPFGHELSSLSAEWGSTFFLALSVLLIGLVVVRAVVQLLQGWLSLTLKRRAQHAISGELFTGYINRPYAFHLRTNGAEIFIHIWQNVAQISQSYIVGLADLISNTLLALAIVASLFWLQPKITLIVAAALGGLTLIIWLSLHRPLDRWGKEWTALSKAVMRAIQEPFTGIKLVKLGGREPFFRAAFLDIVEKSTRANQKYTFALQASRPLLETLIVCGMIVVTIWATTAGHKASDLLAVIALFGMGAYRLLPAAIRIIGIFQSMQFTANSLRQVTTDLDDIRRSARPQGASEGAAEVMRFAESLRMENIAYRYERSDQSAIQDLSLEFRPGESIALVGESGAGKTTAVDLMLGLLKPSSGRIILDGKEVEPEALSYRRLFSYVTQEPFIVDGSLRQNVALGRLPHEIDVTRMHAALASAELSEVVARLPDGLNSQLGERGLRLSGGERQRLGLARALYDQPQILVLDEATSALDANTEDRISKAIETLRGSVTVVFIAHRLSTIQHCDRLFFFERGRVSAWGTFDDLMKKNENFRNTVRKMSLARA